MRSQEKFGYGTYLLCTVPYLSLRRYGYRTVLDGTVVPVTVPHGKAGYKPPGTRTRASPNFPSRSLVNIYKNNSRLGRYLHV